MSAGFLVAGPAGAVQEGGGDLVFGLRVAVDQLGAGLGGFRERRLWDGAPGFFEAVFPGVLDQGEGGCPALLSEFPAQGL